MNALSRRTMAMGLVAFGLVCCFKQPDPVGRDVRSVKDRSVPPGSRLMSSYGPGREGEILRASWEIETDMNWNAYAAWVVAQLPEFQVQVNDVDRLRMSRTLEGDVYTLTFGPGPDVGKGPRIEATFEARPF